MAKQLFHGKGKYNCAQAILKAFQKYGRLPDQQILQHKSSGGGRAPGGICGALYAARLHLSDAAEISDMEAAFKEKAGYITCREIRKNKTLTCVQCVETAAKILKEKMDKTPA